MFNLDQTRLPANNATTIGLLAGGIVIAGVGIALLVVGVKRSKKGGKKKKKKKKDDDDDAMLNRGPHLTGIGPAVLRGGGRSVRWHPLLAASRLKSVPGRPCSVRIDR